MIPSHTINGIFSNLSNLQPHFLHLDHKIKMEKMRLKIGKIRKYAIDSEAWYHYAVGSIVTLVAILIAFVVAFKFFS